jgi:tetratricopeptide (TPR) repeat protein
MLPKGFYKTIILVSLSVFTLAAFADRSATVSPRTANETSQFSWTMTSWTGDDKPYQKIRTDLEALANGGQLTKSVSQSYQEEATHNPHDAQAVFRATYSFYLGRQLHPPINATKVMSDLIFEAAPSPHTYNYARTRFLNDATYIPKSEYVSLAQRLLKHTPNDYDVEYYLIRCFKPWKSHAEKQEALHYTHDLIKKNPNKPSAYSTLGYVYFSTWMAKHNRSDAKQAITAFQKYLAIAPSNYNFRTVAQNTIEYIKENNST